MGRGPSCAACRSGGYLSLAFRARFPERVAALVLVDTGPGFRDPSARERWNSWANDLADRLERDGLDALPRGHEQAAEQHVHGAAGLAHAARGMLTQQDSSVFESLGDVAVPDAHHRRLRGHAVPGRGRGDEERRIAGARRVVVAGAGHAANLDAPVEFNAAVSEFMEGL